jgi:D-alanine--poly(phosphoribitol) ligase subunit 1
VVREHAGRKALLWSLEEHTTYGQLDRVSNQAARLLLDRGVRKRDVVAICREKDLAAYAVILACVKIGAAYVAVDPANPPARLKSILDQCRPTVAVIGGDRDSQRFGCDTLVVHDDDGGRFLSGIDDGDVRPPWEIHGSDPAYIMFTSGSTGAPKGATISHANLFNFIHWARREFGIGPDDVLTGLNPLFFDNSVFDLYASVFSGASLVPFSAAVMRDPHAAVARVGELGCTVYFSVPSLLVYLQRLKLIGPESFRSLRVIIFGGEGYPKPMLAKLYGQVGQRIELCNVYGPTECTCICSAHRIEPRDLADLSGYAPLGHLTSDFFGLVLDDAGREVAPGQVGELYLGGPNVGLGYYGAPEQTAAVFVQNPTHDRFFDRVYRTGDLVRRGPEDQWLHFAGRLDSQIKRQGYRIELGEIEHALMSVDGVEEAAAVYTTSEDIGRITAVVASGVDLASGGVRRELADALPPYMMPDHIMVVRALPRNPNGKIDRKAIAASLAKETR